MGTPASVRTQQPNCDILKYVMASGDTGIQAQGDTTLRSIQVFGTFGLLGTVVLEGSNDSTNWATLNDVSGNAISMTSAGIRVFQAPVLKIRPRITGGDGTTSLTILIQS